jgi:hypothetical protein
MKNANLLSAVILAGALALLVPAASAQEAAPALVMTRTVEWAAGRVVMDVRRALDTSTPSIAGKGGTKAPRPW